MNKKSLYPKQEFIIDTDLIMIGSLIFWLVFFVIGGFWRYYIPMGV